MRGVAALASSKLRPSTPPLCPADSFPSGVVRRASFGFISLTGGNQGVGCSDWREAGGGPAVTECIGCRQDPPIGQHEPESPWLSIPHTSEVFGLSIRGLGPVAPPARHIGDLALASRPTLAWIADVPLIDGHPLSSR